MNAILSIKPEFVTKIAIGKKRYEYRKSMFKRPVEKVYIYASSPVSRIIGEFQPVDVISGEPGFVWQETSDYSGITKLFYDEYFKTSAVAYAIVIQNFVKYETPLALPKGVHAPQSYCFIESL